MKIVNMICVVSVKKTLAVIRFQNFQFADLIHCLRMTYSRRRKRRMKKVQKRRRMERRRKRTKRRRLKMNLLSQSLKK